MGEPRKVEKAQAGDLEVSRSGTACLTALRLTCWTQRLQKQMLKEDKKLGLSRDIEPEEPTPVEDEDLADEPATGEPDVEDSDTDAVEAALAEFAINEEPLMPTEEAQPVPASNGPQADAEDGGASSDEDGDDAPRRSAGMAEPQMSKRDKRRAREARKKLEAETAASGQSEVSLFRLGNRWIALTVPFALV